MRPRKPIALVGWLRAPTRRDGGSGFPRWALFILLVAATLVIGTWGFSVLNVSPGLTLLQSAYHAVKLYTIDLGPAAGLARGVHGVPVEPNWQIVLAFVLAMLLVVRAVIALARDQLARRFTRHVIGGHMIVCGGGVHGARLVAHLAADNDVVLVDIDSSALGMQSVRGDHEWRHVGDATKTETLRWVGAQRARWICAITGNDYVNSQIVSALRDVARERKAKARPHVLVQVEDPSLARFLEEEPERPDQDGMVLGTGQKGVDSHGDRDATSPIVTPFSANAIAAGELLEQIEYKNHRGEHRPLLEAPGARRPHLILAGDHPLIDAIILAVLKRRRVGLLRELESGTEHQLPSFRVSIYGFNAVERVERLRRRWRPEPDVLILDAKDSDSTQVGTVEEDEWLRERRDAGHAIVACLGDRDGLALTLRISRALGDGVLMTRVTALPESVLDERLEDHTRGSRNFATTDVKAIADLTSDRRGMERLASRERLVDALGPDPGAMIKSAEFFDRRELEIHSDSTWRVARNERPLLQALIDPVPLSALVGAGLAVNLSSWRNLRVAAERLSAKRESLPAFWAWCEFARHSPARDIATARAALGDSAEDQLADILLTLRAFALARAEADGARDAKRSDGVAEARTDPAEDTHDAVVQVGLLNPQSSVLGHASQVAIFAGGAASMPAPVQARLQSLLKRALVGYDGVVLSGGTRAGLPGVVGAVAKELGLRCVGYVPANRGDHELYSTLRVTSGVAFSVREPLAMWTDILAANIKASDVCVVVCPGGPITTAEILLARALGARIAWLDPMSDAELPLDEMLPLGADDILEPPVDAMTLRAFLIWSHLPDELREPIARHIHNAYRRKQRRSRPSGDPSLARWDDLPPALKVSNFAEVDDIPNKLAIIGKKLAQGAHRMQLTDEDVELLAEMEHGRYNIERLSVGWQLGQRAVLHGISPYLKPWDELTEEEKQWDRDAVLNVDPALLACGWGVVDIDDGHRSTPSVAEADHSSVQF